eukprot:scaffold840_cov344-Pavlova_lutheri.AAC.55
MVLSPSSLPLLLSPTATLSNCYSPSPYSPPLPLILSLSNCYSPYSPPLPLLLSHSLPTPSLSPYSLSPPSPSLLPLSLAAIPSLHPSPVYPSLAHLHSLSALPLGPIRDLPPSHSRSRPVDRCSSPHPHPHPHPGASTPPKTRGCVCSCGGVSARARKAAVRHHLHRADFGKGADPLRLAIETQARGRTETDVNHDVVVIVPTRRQERK